MLDLYTTHRKVRRLFRIAAHTHQLFKLTGDLVSSPHCRIDRVIFNMVNHDNDRYLLYKVSIDIYYDIGNIVNKIKVEVKDEYVSHTIKELIKLRYHVSECSIISPKIIYILLCELCTE